jgi:hypothetical protein
MHTYTHIQTHLTSLHKRVDAHTHTHSCVNLRKYVVMFNFSHNSAESLLCINVGCSFLWCIPKGNKVCTHNCCIVPCTVWYNHHICHVCKYEINNMFMRYYCNVYRLFSCCDVFFRLIYFSCEVRHFDLIIVLSQLQATAHDTWVCARDSPWCQRHNMHQLTYVNTNNIGRPKISHPLPAQYQRLYKR